jgi:hypothetical protein
MVLCNILDNICEIIKTILTLVPTTTMSTNLVLCMNINCITKHIISHIFYDYIITKIIHQMVNITFIHV